MHLGFAGGFAMAIVIAAGAVVSSIASVPGLGLHIVMMRVVAEMLALSLFMPAIGGSRRPGILERQNSKQQD
ncbi:hypothetical protein LJR289_000498 [Pseudoduganella sp. LjRoot289]